MLPGSSGSHNVCVCMLHQNAKLMFQSAKLTSAGIELHDYYEKFTLNYILSFIKCNPPTIACCLNNCSLCNQKYDLLLQNILKYFEENLIDDISYKSWQSTDRTTLETIVTIGDDFA